MSLRFVCMHEVPTEQQKEQVTELRQTTRLFQIGKVRVRHPSASIIGPSDTIGKRAGDQNSNKFMVPILMAGSKSRYWTRRGQRTPERRQRPISESISSLPCNPYQHRSHLRTGCMAWSESSYES